MRTGDDLRSHLLGPTTRALNLSCRERPLRAGHEEALRLRDDSEPETTEAFLCASRSGTRHPRLVDASVEGCGADAGSGKFGHLEPLANAPAGETRGSSACVAASWRVLGRVSPNA